MRMMDDHSDMPEDVHNYYHYWDVLTPDFRDWCWFFANANNALPFLIPQRNNTYQPLFFPLTKDKIILVETVHV